METVRIDLGSGDYAVVLREMRHGTTRKLDRLMEDQMGREAYVALITAVQQAPDEAAKLALLKGISVRGEDEVTLLNQVVEWSFGKTVDQVALDNIPSVKYAKLVEEVDKLYKPVPLAHPT